MVLRRNRKKLYAKKRHLKRLFDPKNLNKEINNLIIIKTELPLLQIFNTLNVNKPLHMYYLDKICFCDNLYEFKNCVPLG